MKRAATIKDYIRAAAPESRKHLKTLEREIAALLPNADPVISYGMPAFRLSRVLVYFAAHEHHIGFYPTSGPIKAFAKELAKFEHSKGAVRFSLDEALPLGLIRRMVKYRLKEHFAKSRGRTWIKPK